MGIPDRSKRDLRDTICDCALEQLVEMMRDSAVMKALERDHTLQEFGVSRLLRAVRQGIRDRSSYHLNPTEADERLRRPWTWNQISWKQDCRYDCKWRQGRKQPRQRHSKTTKKPQRCTPEFSANLDLRREEVETLLDNQMVGLSISISTLHWAVMAGLLRISYGCHLVPTIGQFR